MATGTLVAIAMAGNTQPGYEKNIAVRHAICQAFFKNKFSVNSRPVPMHVSRFGLGLYKGSLSMDTPLKERPLRGCHVDGESPEPAMHGVTSSNRSTSQFVAESLDRLLITGRQAAFGSIVATSISRF